ncbi:MAG TPA: hypothetical protein VIJ34_13625 [Acidimicrobiales bacterium]
MSAMPSRLEAATHFRLRSRRIVSKRSGYDARSTYVEQFWLPVLGPSTTLLIRHLNIRLERDGEDVVLEAALTARALGLGEHPGRHAPFLRSIRRAIDYDLVSVGERDENSPQSEVQLLVRRLVPMLSNRLAERLPEPLAREHRCALARSETEETPLARRARQLARTHQQLVTPPRNVSG